MTEVKQNALLWEEVRDRVCGMETENHSSIFPRMCASCCEECEYRRGSTRTERPGSPTNPCCVGLAKTAGGGSPSSGLRHLAVDDPRHHWHALHSHGSGAQVHNSLQQRLHLFIRPSVNTALVMRSSWKRGIKEVLVCLTPELIQPRKPRRSSSSTRVLPLRTLCFSLIQFLKLVTKSFRMLDMSCVHTAHVERDWIQLKFYLKRTLHRVFSRAFIHAPYTCHSRFKAIGLHLP